MTRRTAAEIRAYCEAATEGPWQRDGGYADYVLIMNTSPRPEDYENYVEIASIDLEEHGANPTPEQEANIAFLINARTDLPRLLADAVALREAADWVMHLAHGIAKNGGPPTDKEWTEAQDALMAAIKDAAYLKGER